MFQTVKLIERIGNTANEMLTMLRSIAFGIETVNKVKRFSASQSFNLKAEGAGKGVRHFTVRNIGKSIMYVSTSSLEEREPVNPFETFAINSPHRVCDEQVLISFGAEHPDFANANVPNNEAIARFLVDKC